MTTIEQIMQSSKVTFGTSGARGLVCDMTDQVCYAYTLGFIQYLEQTQQIQKKLSSIVIAGDLRKSTPRIMNACAQAIVDSGYGVINAGLIPTPAVALYGLENHCPAIMVTGSHIPDDRNGIKFYKLSGEILKADEAAIREQNITLTANDFSAEGAFNDTRECMPAVDDSALRHYLSRYKALFPDALLVGKKIGVYQHSSVARDIIAELLEHLGAQVICLGFSENFIPVDTEAVREEDHKLAKQWLAEHHLDAIVSTDGDADRPLMFDEYGHCLRGDIIGFICARYLHIDHIVTPVSSNTCVEKANFFVAVKRTRIGSPYVIEAMNHYIEDHYAAVAGYEANGGFLLATPIRKNNHLLTALPTRDAIIVLLSVLCNSAEQALPLSKLLATLPARYTHSDRIKNFANEKSQQLIARYTQSDDLKNKQSIEADFPQFGSVIAINTTDGLRIIFDNEDIIHFRPSGNAPEFRCYSESNSIENAQAINKMALDTLLSAK